LTALTEGKVAVSIQLPSELCISEVNALKSDLLASLAVADDTVELDASRVERIDTAGVQLLLAVTRYLESRSLGLRWTHPSAALCEAAHELGASDQLQLPTQ
jgi:anti-anti-sigma regulatory factor